MCGSCLTADDGSYVQVPCAAFLIFHAASMAFIGPRWANDAHPRTKPEDFTVPPKWIPFPSTTVFLHHEARRMLADNFGENASGRSDTDRLWDVFERCRLTIHRSCRELEPGMFTLLSELLRKPAVPAGILLPGATDDRHEDDWQSSSGGVLRWLDDQPPKSVVYVALGSEAPLTLENIHELALGLELAGVRFLWALRRPADTNNKQELLPAGFEERTRARGLVCTGWVPQVKVLAHGATAAFLTHCDWGSTIESFAFGLPLVMLPFLTDTPMIARAMAERGIGVQVARDESDGSFDKHGVAEAVRRVMVDGQGKEVFATNAKKLKELVVDEGRQEQYIHELEEHLIRYKEARSSTSTS
uniref:UDP-glycosyltransferases domain-containing protein n=1 Tax=Aegilops tauschii subsp. strangulata TaxID=200361 RepID=A0A453QLN1_AEGTS